MAKLASEFDCRVALPEPRGIIRVARDAEKTEHVLASEAERQRALQGGGTELDAIGGDTIRRRPQQLVMTARLPCAPDSPAEEEELARLVDAPELESARIARAYPKTTADM